MGKTWALRELAETVLQYDPPARVEGTPPGAADPPEVGARLSRIGGVHSVYVDVLDWSAHFDCTSKEELDAGLKRLLHRLSLQIAEWANTVPTGVLTVKPADGLVADFSRWLEADVRQFTHEFVLVLLLDQAHEAPWKLLELLDQHLLGPLAAIPRVLPIVAGRGQGYPFKSPEMYLHCKSIRLEPFDNEQTKAQIAKQVPDEKQRKVPLDQIYGLSGGYPRLSYAIATLGADAGLRAELDTILAPVKDEALLKRLRDEYLKAICVLRSFDDDRAVMMLRRAGTSGRPS